MMNVLEIATGPPIEEGSGDLLVVPVLSERTWGPGAEWVVEQLGEWVEPYLEAEEFTGASGQMARIATGGRLPYRNVLFLGLGDEVDAEALRRAGGNVGRSAAAYQTVVTTLHALDVDGAAEAVAFGFDLGQYRFDKYRSEPKPSKTERLFLAGAGGEVEDGVGRGRIIAAGVALARDLINEPPVSKSPETLAAAAAQMAEAVGIDVEVYDQARIEAERLGGVLAVNSGSEKPARVVVLRYEPAGASASIALVGKGIVFDSGGLSIKPAAAMETMKTDMSGAAAVFGAMQAIARLGLAVKVLGITPLTENMPGGAAQRPGDVMRARNGKTIEVLNTDAEGRLVLADGLSLAAEESPDLIVDIATLTGACAVALGPKIGGLWTNDDAAGERVLGAAGRAGEVLWKMPLEREYRSAIESQVADMKNTGERYGSAIAAALILSEFVGDRPWVHLDIAGPARVAKAEHYLTQGGAGFGVRTLVALAEDMAAAD